MISNSPFHYFQLIQMIRKRNKCLRGSDTLQLTQFLCLIKIRTVIAIKTVKPRSALINIIVIENIVGVPSGFFSVNALPCGAHYEYFQDRLQRNGYTIIYGNWKKNLGNVCAS